MHAWLVTGSVILAGGTALSSVPAPAFHQGDKWVFDQTQERGTQLLNQQKLDLVVERPGSGTMILGIKRDGAPEAYEDHEVGSDWSGRRILDGEDKTTTRPFLFPLTVGKTWTIDYTDPTRRGLQTAVHVHRTYKVAGWEEVIVPAGRFRAMKVESSGIDQVTVLVPGIATGAVASVPGASAATTRTQAGGTRLVNVRYHSEFDYVPEEKNYVKSVEEQYNTDEVLLTRDTRVLVSFDPGTL